MNVLFAVIKSEFFPHVSVHEGSVRVTTCATVDSDDDDMCVDEIKDDTLRRFAHREKDFISILSCTPGQ